MDDLFSNETNRRPGFRLHKLEVYNWGTFDSTTGSVHLVRPEGRRRCLSVRMSRGSQRWWTHC